MIKGIGKILGLIIIAVLFCLAGIILVSGRFRQLSYVTRIANEQYSDERLPRDLKYRLYVMNMPLGYLTLSVEPIQYNDQDVSLSRLSLRPGQLLRTISSNNIGIDFTSWLDKNSLLPYRFEQNPLYYIKKGKKAKAVIYDHDNLILKRKGNIGDIQDDTRDPVSLILWIMSHDYEKVKLIKTTFSINRTIYLAVGKAEDIKGALVKVRFKIMKLDKAFKVVNSSAMTVHLLKRKDFYLPILFDVKKGFISAKVALQ